MERINHLTLHPITLKDANDFITTYHRHHKKVVGHKFSISVRDQDGNLRGVVIVGRPVARYCDDGVTAEVTRLCTDGTQNACSTLYAAAARAAKAMGYLKIQTYTLEEEPGVSLIAAGWLFDRVTKGGKWSGTYSGKPRKNDHPTTPKKRWVKWLGER